MTGGDLSCPRCGSALRLAERASRRAGKLIYDCRECGRHFSLPGEASELVEEEMVEDSGTRTARLRAPGFGRRPAGRLTELQEPSARGALPEGLTVTLEITDGPQRGRTLTVEHSRSVIGREEGEIRIDDPLVSRRHALLEVFDAETIILKDLTSTNGTYHNGRLIDHCKLADGDEVRMGTSILNVLIEREPAEPRGAG